MGEKQEQLRKQLRNAELLCRLADADHCKIVMAINDELARAGESIEFDTENIGVTSKGIFEQPLGSHDLSKVFSSLGFPSIRQKGVSHYTSYNSFRAIAETKRLRLYAVRKRISENELEAFLKQLGLRGTEVDPISQMPIHEELSDHLFYTSFTEGKNSPYMWQTFAAGSTGVRLDFSITANVGDFRSLSYSLADSPIAKLFSRLQSEFNRSFLLRGISKLCAFHLPCQYAPEHEDRMLLAQHTDDYQFGLNIEKDDSGHSFVALPIGSGSAGHYEIDLVGVSPGSACDPKTFQADVNRLGINHLVC